MENIFSVKNKVAFITGASSGIGRHFAITLAKYGAHIILIGRNQQRLIEVEQECQKHGAKTLAILADVKNSNDINRAINTSKQYFDEVNILINAAGVVVRAPILEFTEANWDTILETNLKGTFLVSQAIAKWMMAAKTAGKIINISSSAAFHVTPGRAAYSASKLAVEGLTRSLALNFVANHISVNCIAPGFFVTDINRNYLQTELGKNEIAGVPQQRAADVAELEGVLLLLASNASSYMTGSVVHVDGGYAIGKV